MLPRWFRNLRTRGELERDLIAELDAHRALLVDEQIEAGATLAAARRAAQLEMGAVEAVKDGVRDVRAGAWLESWLRDLQYGFRQLRRAPLFAATVVITLALGIGANTAIFSLINGLLLHRLPVTRPEQLVLIADPSRGGNLPAGVPNQMPFMWNYRLWEEIRQRPDLFQSACAYFYSRFDLASGGETEFVDGLYVSGEFFRTVGVSPTVGRLLTDGDDQRGTAVKRVAVIGHDFWRRRFGGDPDVVGQVLNVERLPFTIVGVLPAGFVGPAAGRAINLAIPVAEAEEIRGRQVFEGTGVNWITIMARLKPGQGLESAAAALRGVQPQIRQASLPPRSQNSDDYLKNPLTLLPAERGNLLDPLRVRAQRPLLTLQMAVVLVLLIACVNVANLTLARATARRHEMSVRLALGASRRRVARQLFVEALLLALLGAASAIPVSQWALRILVRLFSTGVNTLAIDLAPDARVLLFTSLTAIATAVATGIFPVRRATRVQPIDALKESNATVLVTRLRLANGFVIAQVALSLVLVIAGGLLIRTYANLATMDLGFDPGGMLIVDVGTGKARIDPASRLAIFERVRQAAAAVPGVTGAALADVSPVTGAAMAGDVEVRGRPAGGSRETFVNRVSPGWLSLYRTSMLTGRDLAGADRPGSPAVAIVNQTFVRKFFGGTDPLGQVVRQVDGPLREWTVVGVTADAVYDSMRAAAPPTMYVAFGQIDDELLAAGAAPASASLSVRVTGRDARTLSRSIATAIANVNPDLDLTFRPLPAIVSGALTIERSLALLSGLFGGLALLLAAIGLYGVTSYEVARRRMEIGIRMALGATRRRVVREVLSRILILVGIGVVIGLTASMWASQFIAALLYGLKSRDPQTLVGAVVALIAVGALAGWLPASRAAQLDPIVTLRRE